MRFEVEGAAPIDDPTAAQIDQGLRALSLPDRTFAILSLTDSDYMQTSPEDEGSFLLEYQDGSPDEHFRVPEPVALEGVVGAFQSFRRRDGEWRSGFQWERVDLAPPRLVPPPPRERRQMSRGRVLARLGIGLAWTLLQVIVFVAIAVAGGLLGGLAALAVPAIFALPVILGFALGIAAGLVVCHQARMWLLRLRIRRLRSRGRQGRATVVWVDKQFVPSGRGLDTTTYTVYVRWQDPASGEAHEYERQYRFWSAGSPALERLLHEPSLPILYSPRHPSRFAIDIPFAPTMADLVLTERSGQVQPAAVRPAER